MATVEEPFFILNSELFR